MIGCYYLINRDFSEIYPVAIEYFSWKPRVELTIPFPRVGEGPGMGAGQRAQKKEATRWDDLLDKSDQ